MAKRELMGWLPKSKQWQKRYSKTLYKVSCRQLKKLGLMPIDAPETKDGSVGAANRWWEAKVKELEQEPPAPPVPYEKQQLLRMVAWFRQRGETDNADAVLEHANSPEVADYYRNITEHGKILWEDRFSNSESKPTENTLETTIAQFLGWQKSRAVAGEISLGRWDLCQRYLRYWSNWIGAVDPAALNGMQLSSYKQHLLDTLGATDDAGSKLAAVKQFYNWLHEDAEILERLPRNFRRITIKPKRKAVKILDIDYIKTVLTHATEREQLYLLLMLNTGMQQKDISDLLNSEIDFQRGTITRARSKVPDGAIVVYPMWKTTQRLLRQFVVKGEYALENKRGGRLVEAKLKDGKYVKYDNIGCGFHRLCKRENITPQPLKLIRKTSSTLLRNSKHYSQFARLLLGRFPQGVDETHYWDAGGENFFEAVRWLGGVYGIE